MQFLRNFDQLSFWIGFIVGSLFWVIFGRLFARLKDLRIAVQNQIHAAQESRQIGAEVRYQNNVIRSLQGLHIAAPLFSLDEILVPPRIIAPIVRTDPESEDSYIPDVVAETIPYLPDWPELPALYNYPTISLPEALSKGANLALIGHLGSGKTVSLAYLTTLVARKECGFEELNNLFPIFLHSGDLQIPDLDSENEEDIAGTIIQTISNQVKEISYQKLEEIILPAFNDGRVLLLLDGLDELPPESIDKSVQFLEQVFVKYPKTRAVVAVSPYYYDGITSIGLWPVAIAGWGRQQAIDFIQKWSSMWVSYIQMDVWQDTQPQLSEPEEEMFEAESLLEEMEPIILNNWLRSDDIYFSPLELILRVWACYSGDTLGPKPPASLEAFFRRLTTNIPNADTALERLAHQMILNMQPIANDQEIRKWIREPGQTEKDLGEDLHAEEFEEDIEIEEQEITSQKSVRSQVIRDLINIGLLVHRRDSQIGFAHPTFVGYFAGRSLARSGGSSWVLNQPNWTGKIQAINYMVTYSDSPGFNLNLSDEDPKTPLKNRLFTAARWLRGGTERGARWRLDVMRELASTLQSNEHPSGLRARALTALVISGDPGVVQLCKKLIQADDPILRQLAALGLGFLMDLNSIDILVELIYDHVPGVQRAACLALASLGTQQAIDAIGTALLHGEDNLRQIAAESLANHVEEGYQILKEASEVEDLLVRRASVFGLKRINEPWSFPILQDLQTQDEQWVVRTAANQAVLEITSGPPSIPKPHPPLHELTWLVLFAGESGEGMSPGKSAQDMLLRALRDGNEEQKLAAMDTLNLFTYDNAIRNLYQEYYYGEVDLREASLNTLWHMAVSGVGLPSPLKFGIGTSNI